MLTSSSVNGQNNPIKSTELDSLYVRALNSRIDLLLSSGWKYIELNEYGNRIKSLNVSDRFKFLTNDELIDLSIKKNKTINIISLNHKKVAKDTIDIVFGDISINAKRGIFFKRGIQFKKAEFSVGCRGTNGYQSDIRFVYNRNENKWNILTNRFVSSQENQIKEFTKFKRNLLGNWVFEKAVNERGDEVKLSVLNKPLKVGIIMPNIHLKEDYSYIKKLSIDKKSKELGTWKIVSTDDIEFTNEKKEINLVKIISLSPVRLVLKSNENYFYQYIKTSE